MDFRLLDTDPSMLYAAPTANEAYGAAGTTTQRKLPTHYQHIVVVLYNKYLPETLCYRSNVYCSVCAECPP